MSDTSTRFCPRCGAPQGACAADCGERHRLDPDRYCAICGRRLRVQVLPNGVESFCKVCRLRALGRLRS